MCQSRNSFASASVERLTGERKPIACNLGVLVDRLASTSQALAPAQWREDHGAELLCARQAAHTGIAGVALHDAHEARPRCELHDPGERRL